MSELFEKNFLKSTKNMSTLANPLSIMGQRSQGRDVRTQNVLAASSIANIVKSSLGPVGLDKMLVDDVGDVTVTNDGATILKLLEVEHPAAKVIIYFLRLIFRIKVNSCPFQSKLFRFCIFLIFIRFRSLLVFVKF